jgi:hypothetical protein
MRSILIGIVVAAVLLATSPAFPMPVPVLVETCGQMVPAKAAAYLAADLDCSTFSGAAAVELGKRASLDLGSFTLTTGELYGVTCREGRCAVRNGTVTGAGYAGILGANVLVENVTVTMTGLFGVAVNGATVRGSVIAGSGTIGIYSSGTKKKIRIIDSTVNGHARFGVSTYKVELHNSTVDGNLQDPDCAAGALCADLLTTRRPKLKDSSCGRSQSLPENPFPGCLGWCVCTDD